MIEEDDTSPAQCNVTSMPEVLRLAHKPNELPHYAPYKHFIPDEHTKKTERAAREVYGSVLREVTTNREKHIFRGVLDQAARTVFSESRKAKGNAFHNMGVQSSSGFHFQPEEALIQFEYGIMEIFLSGDSKVPMCLQDLYDIMLPWISTEFYQTYCHLVRLGYTVSRSADYFPSKRLASPHESTLENFTSSDQVNSSEHLTSSEQVTSSIDNIRVLNVRKPLSTQTDFYVVVLENDRKFPSLKSILEKIRIVKKTSVKIATVTDGKVYFYSLAMINFPDAEEIS